MYTTFGAWAIAIWPVLITTPVGAMKWFNEEQFVEGEFPYYPYSSKLYSLTDGLKDDEALANEFSAANADKSDTGDRKVAFPISRKRSLLNRAHKSSFYEFKNDSDTVIDATKYEVNEKVENRKSLGKIGRLVLKNAKTSSKKSKTNVPRSVRESLRDVDVKPEIQIGFEEQKTQFFDDELSPQPSKLISDRVLRNLSGPLAHKDGLEDLIGFKPDEKYNSKNSGVKINPPYENNFSGGGFRYTNPSTWLAREIEKFVRRKDYRWLDFMKNNGLETNGVMVETKHQPEKTRKLNNNRIIGCLRRDDKAAAEGLTDGRDKSDEPQQTLLRQIDGLLEDLSQFRASVKNDESDKTPHYARPVNQRRNVRETRSVTLPSFRGKSEPQGPIVNHPRVTSSLVLDDLKDLKKNIVLYENNLIDDEDRQALDDLRLHIKVYVENNEKASNEEK